MRFAGIAILALACLVDVDSHPTPNRVKRASASASASSSSGDFGEYNLFEYFFFSYEQFMMLMPFIVSALCECELYWDNVVVKYSGSE
ncbi:unnamed protein product [Allacma fusca]|uniref:Uncharacterized protein n=1 Tax=Allacma fusca TaxID=39272 RepID=A0A8J2L082_9HEXA|nr:unnamed protein product [Allacma fusca]